MCNSGAQRERRLKENGVLIRNSPKGIGCHNYGLYYGVQQSRRWVALVVAVQEEDDGVGDGSEEHQRADSKTERTGKTEVDEGEAVRERRI